MSPDERAIRDLVATWLAASRAGDLATVLNLMADDVLFLVPGREPFGKQEFAAAAAGLKDLRMEAASDIQEIRIFGQWAFLRSRLAVTMTPLSGGRPMRRSGATLTILCKRPDGQWVVARDANLLTPDNEPSAEPRPD